jgi:hypothetical protein
MITRTLGVDELTRVETVHHYDEATDITTIEHKQDAAPIIERNKALQNTEHQKRGLKSGFMHLATIPNPLIMVWAKEIGSKDLYGSEMAEYMAKKLKLPEYRYLTVGNMRS